MNKFSKQEVFETMPVPKAVANLAIPTILGMLVIIIYNLADTFFVGQIGDPNQVAAVTISTPIFIILLAFGNLFGLGGGSYISRLLGSKDYDNVKKTTSFAFYSCIIVGALVAILGTIFLDDIIHLLGSSKNTFQFSKDYLFTVILGAPAIIASCALGQLIRSEGAAKESMIGMMLGTIINIILDPIFIIGLKMGVFGAAIATVIANAISVVYFIIYLIKSSEFLSISPKHFKPKAIIVKNVFAIGTPAALTSALFSFSTILLNNFAVTFGDTTVAAIGIVGKINLLPVYLAMGLGQGVQPLVGYSYAANNMTRLKKTINYAAVVGTIFEVLITILLFFVGEFAVGIFINDVETVELGVKFLRINLISMPIFGILFLLMNTFQALGKAIPSLFLSIARQGFVFIPVLIIGTRLFGLNGIVYSQPIADIACAIMSVIMALIVFRKDFKSESKSLAK